MFVALEIAPMHIMLPGGIWMIHDLKPKLQHIFTSNFAGVQEDQHTPVNQLNAITHNYQASIRKNPCTLLADGTWKIRSIIVSSGGEAPQNNSGAAAPQCYQIRLASKHRLIMFDCGAPHLAPKHRMACNLAPQHRNINMSLAPKHRKILWRRSTTFSGVQAPKFPFTAHISIRHN